MIVSLSMSHRKVQPPKFQPEKNKPDCELEQKLKELWTPQDEPDYGYVPAIWCATYDELYYAQEGINIKMRELVENGYEILDFEIFPSKEIIKKIDRKTTTKKVVEYLLIIKYRKRRTKV